VCSHSHPYDNNFSRVVSLYLLFSLLKVQNKNKIQGNNNFLLFIFCLFTVSLCLFLFQSGWPSLDAFTRITCCLFVGYHYIYPFLPLPSIGRCSSHYFLCICISPLVFLFYYYFIFSNQNKNHPIFFSNQDNQYLFQETPSITQETRNRTPKEIERKCQH
jgi:hypothetical protein